MFSFRGLKIADPSGFNSAKKLPVDLNAGADLLHKYQTEWEEMHIMAEENALAAQVKLLSEIKYVLWPFLSITVLHIMLTFNPSLLLV